MRVVLDTNILVSALIAPAGNPAAIYNAWEQGKFTLLTCAEHLDELRRTQFKSLPPAHACQLSQPCATLQHSIPHGASEQTSRPNSTRRRRRKHPVFRHGTTSEAAWLSGAHQGQPPHFFPQ